MRCQMSPVFQPPSGQGPRIRLTGSRTRSRPRHRTPDYGSTSGERMNLRQTQQGLWVLASVFAAGGVAAVFCALRMPYDQPEARPFTPPPAPLTRTDPAINAPALEQFVGLWSRNLRRPLFDPPPAPSHVPDVQATPKVTRPDIRLIGYTVEHDRSLAILAGPDGTVEFKTVGEQLHGVTIRAIAPTGVTMEFNGDEFLLRFQEPANETESARTPRTVDRSRYGTGRLD